MITLSEEQVKQLEQVLAQTPMMYGVPIMNILNAAAKAEEKTDE